MSASKVNQFSIVYPKQIALLLECSETTAKKIHREIKEHYELPKYVLYKHFVNYFKIGE